MTRLTLKQWIRVAFVILSIAVMVIGSVIIFRQKEAFSLDEYSSYGCANGTVNGKTVPYEQGKAYTYEEINQLVMETYAVTPEYRFRFDKVWENMTNNVHPPVFYAALHLVCSLTPGVFSVWQAAVVNLFFGLISLIFFSKFAYALIRSEWLAGLMCLCWSGTLGFFSIVVFLRDYMTATCGTIIFAWEAFRFLRGHRKPKDIIKLALASVLTVLSHYYCAIYIFFACAVLCIILMRRKEWRDVIGIMIAEVCAAGVALAIFPALITCMFSSGRGQQSTDNLMSRDASAFLDRLEYFYTAVNKRFFGGLLLYAGILMVILAVVYWIMKKKNHLQKAGQETEEIRPADLCLLCIPAVLYFFLVSKVAAMVGVRYMYAVTPVMYISVIALLIFLGRRLCNNPAVLRAILAAAMVAMCALGWSTGKLYHMSIGLNELIENTLTPYQGVDAVQIWDKASSWHCVSIPQYSYYNTITLLFKCKDEQLKDIAPLKEGKNAMLIIAKNNNREGYLEDLKRLYPEYAVDELGCIDGESRFYNYYFHKD